MTATYDGKLLLKEKSIEPCCSLMAEALCLDAVKVGTQAKRRIVKISVAHKWFVLKHCPFCGAKVEDCTFKAVSQ